MPRGVKGSGKGRKPATEPGRPRRRGRKPNGPLPEVVPPVEPASTLPPTEEPVRGRPTEEERAAEGSPAEEALPAQPPELAAAEAELVRKYPAHRFKRGSLLASGATAELGAKRSVVILCRDCGAERRIATSDVFHTSRCLACTARARKEARRSTSRKRERHG